MRRNRFLIYIILVSTISTFTEVNTTSNEPVEITELKTRNIIALSSFNIEYNGYRIFNLTLLDVTFSNGIVISNLSAGNYNHLLTQLESLQGGSLDVSSSGNFYSYENINSSGKFFVDLWERFQIKGDNEMAYQGVYCTAHTCFDFYNFSEENQTEIFVDSMKLNFFEKIWSSTVAPTTTNANVSFLLVGVIFISVINKLIKKQEQ